MKKMIPMRNQGSLDGCIGKNLDGIVYNSFFILFHHLGNKMSLEKTDSTHSFLYIICISKLSKISSFFEFKNEWRNSFSKILCFIPTLKMDVDVYEDRPLEFEAKLKELYNADDDFKAAERKGMKNLRRSTHQTFNTHFSPHFSVVWY